MDAGLSRSRKNKKREQADRHGWNTLENYEQIYYDRLTTHPFVDHSKPLPEFESFSVEGVLYIGLEGRIYCQNNIVLSLTKLFETRERGSGRLQVRCFSYRYNAKIVGKHNILRYDNGHSDLDYYHKHIFDIQTGKESNKINLTRTTFPLLHEVLDELASMFT